MRVWLSLAYLAKMAEREAKISPIALEMGRWSPSPDAYLFSALFSAPSPPARVPRTSPYYSIGNYWWIIKSITKRNIFYSDTLFLMSN